MAVANAVICVNRECVVSAYSSNPCVRLNHYIEISSRPQQSFQNDMAYCTFCNAYSLVIVNILPGFDGNTVPEIPPALASGRSAYDDNYCLPPAVPYPFNRELPPPCFPNCTLGCLHQNSFRYAREASFSAQSPRPIQGGFYETLHPLGLRRNRAGSFFTESPGSFPPSPSRSMIHSFDFTDPSSPISPQSCRGVMQGPLTTEQMYNDKCGICLDEESNDKILTKCRHVFHRQCLTRWQATVENDNVPAQRIWGITIRQTYRQQNNTCPTCRRELF